ncbi:NAD(P)H-dependent flavin oxidoreductase [Candidatus Binatus sp.]|uniref:NAD(P)H-dependent flavin oxidoreductase n=1 Tax=Candidatus Binatus sp. TaxID=2811406 RepID=UPI003BB1680B
MLSNRLPEKIANRLRLPLIAAPMLSVSGPELTIAACKAGVIGSFPLANARTVDGVDAWLTQIKSELAIAADINPDRPPAPFCPNLIIKRAQMRDELHALVKHRVEMVITSVGSPADAIKPLHDVGCVVFADVASLHHAERAITAGVDGLILLTAGAGGQTGWLNPIAFVRSVRAMFDGPIVLAGGISDGHALWAAEVLGCDLAYMGTKFIATHESMAPPAYKKMLVDFGMDDVMLTQAFTGLDTNMLRPSMIAAGLDPSSLPPRVSNEEAAKKFSSMAVVEGPRRYKDIWSAGHSISGVDRIQSAAELVDRTVAEYLAARDHTVHLLST